MKKEKVLLFLIAVACFGILGYLSITALLDINLVETKTMTASDTVSEKLPIPYPQGDIDPSTADLETLDRLPGVGPATAQAFHDYLSQPGNAFYYPEDICNVKGIGEKKLEDIFPYLSMPTRPPITQTPLFPEENR